MDTNFKKQDVRRVRLEDAYWHLKIAYCKQAVSYFEELMKTMPYPLPRTRLSNEIRPQLAILSKLERVYLRGLDDGSPECRLLKSTLPHIFQNVRSRIRAGEPLDRYVKKNGRRKRYGLGRGITSMPFSVLCNMYRKGCAKIEAAELKTDAYRAI